MNTLTKEDVENRRRWWQSKLYGAPAPLAEETAFWRSEIEICNMALRSLANESARGAQVTIPRHRLECFRQWFHDAGDVGIHARYDDGTPTPNQGYMKQLVEEIAGYLAAPQSASPEAREQKPVAWRVWAKGDRKSSRGVYEYPTPDDFRIWKVDGCEVEPLYATPSKELAPAKAGVTLDRETAKHLYYLTLELGGKCNVCKPFRESVDAIWPKSPLDAEFEPGRL